MERIVGLVVEEKKREAVIQLELIQTVSNRRHLVGLHSGRASVLSDVVGEYRQHTADLGGKRKEATDALQTCRDSVSSAPPGVFEIIYELGEVRRCLCSLADDADGSLSDGSGGGAERR